MKKYFFLLFGLILMLGMQVQSMPSGLIDDDVGYVIADVAIIGTSEFSCIQEKLSLISCNEINMESIYGMCRVDNYKCLIWQMSTDNTTIELKGSIPTNDYLGVSRLDIGESYNRRSLDAFI